MMLNAFPPLGRGSSAASQKTILHARYGKSSVPYHIASTPSARNTCLLFLGAALRVLGLEDRHRPGRLRENNRAENSYLPIRRRERKVQGSSPCPRRNASSPRTPRRPRSATSSPRQGHDHLGSATATSLVRFGEPDFAALGCNQKKFGSGRAGAESIVVASRASTREDRLLCMADQAKPKGTKTS